VLEKILTLVDGGGNMLVVVQVITQRHNSALAGQHHVIIQLAILHIHTDKPLAIISLIGTSDVHAVPAGSMLQHGGGGAIEPQNFRSADPVLHMEQNTATYINYVIIRHRFLLHSGYYEANSMLFSVVTIR